MTAETLDQPITSSSPAPAPEPALGAVPVPAPALAEKPWPVEATIFAWLLITAGALFRLRAFFHWRSLWLDEIYLAHSIVTRGFARLLLQPLDFYQGAPVGFLVIERLFVDLFGTGERILRLPAVLAGVASLPLFYFLARRLLSLRGTLLAMTLFCGLPWLIRYSAELKPYSFDVTTGLAILLSALNVRENPRSGRHLLIFLIVGALGIFFSYTAVFVLAGAGAVVLVSRTAKGISNGLGFSSALAAPLGCIALWGILVWCNVHFFLHPLMYGTVHQDLVKFWMDRGGFPPWQPNKAAHWLWTAFDNIFRHWENMQFDAPELAMFAAIIGLFTLLSGNRRALGAMILLPIALAIVAAFRRQYPMADRLALFMAPFLVILVARGIDIIWSHGDLGRSAAGALAALMIIAGPVSRSAVAFKWPDDPKEDREETKVMYQWIQRNWRPGDLLIVSHMGQQSYDYYAPGAGMAGLTQLYFALPGTPTESGMLLEASKQGETTEPWFAKAFGPHGKPASQQDGYVFLQPNRAANPARYLDDLDHILHPDPAWQWPKVSRVWFLFVHVNDEDPRVDQLCVPELDRLAQQGVRHEEDGATVYFYDVDGPASAFQRN